MALLVMMMIVIILNIWMCTKFRHLYDCMCFFLHIISFAIGYFVLCEHSANLASSSSSTSI